MDLNFLYSSEPLRESHLAECERVALGGDSLAEQIAARLLSEVRRLQHQLADPSFMYAGSRIHRHALVCRDTQVNRLLKEIGRLKEGDFTPEEFQNLCHNLDKTGRPCTRGEHAAACEAYRAKLFGKEHGRPE